MGRVLKFLASIQLGVVIIIALGALTAWGTFVEARYNDAIAAQKIVFHSVWMNLTLGALTLCLIAVMIDRWPWKQRHIGFVLAHIGILFLLTGSLITKRYGLDGSMSIGIGESSKHVAVQDAVLAVYASLGDVAGFRKIGDSRVDFFLHPPTAEKPFAMPLAGGDLQVVDYYRYAFREEKIVESQSQNAGAAVRFQLQNPRVSQTEWLVQPAVGREATKDFGPAQIFLTSGEAPGAVGRNAVILRPKPGGQILDYEIHTAREPKKVRKGTAKAGDEIQTGWMGLVLRILKYMPRAEETVTFKPVEQASPMVTSAIKIRFRDHERWLAENSTIRLFTDQAAYIVTFGNRREELGFKITLKDFKIGRYPGTMRAASYESVVDVPGIGERVISMNEPLKHAGYTFYQASFQEDEQGRPIVSVFSVNQDPGRWIKYFGSLLIVLGTIHLFYFKRKSAKTAAQRPAASNRAS